jgi:ATP-binding cassette, subfamily B, bacterial CvaB/MchF/RaxB
VYLFHDLIKTSKRRSKTPKFTTFMVISRNTFDIQANPEKIQACAAFAAVHEDIARMPMGYQTLVGDMGSSLSGGQKQRILMARALYKQPKVLALDEATSHLDIANEQRVTHALAQLPITRIIVAHRPETIAGAERVVSLQQGRVEQVERH